MGEKKRQCQRETEERKSEEIVIRKKIPTKKYHRTTTAKDIC